MKKKVLKVIILLLCMFYGNNVYAETIWPQMVTAGDYKMIIDGVSLKLYFIPPNPPDQETGYQFYQNVMDGVADKTIDIDTKKDVFEPKLIVGQSDNAKGHYLGLNLDLDDDIKQILMNEVASEDDAGIFADLVAKVKFVETPSNFSNIKKNNESFLDLVNDFSSENFALEYNDSIDIDGYNDLIINSYIIYENSEEVSFSPVADDGEFSFNLDYITDMVGNDDNYLMMFSFDESIVTDYLEGKGFTYEIVTPEASKVNTNNPVTSNESTNNIKDQVVKVVNTGLSIGNYKYVISGLLLGFGMLILYKNVNKKKS